MKKHPAPKPAQLHRVFLAAALNFGLIRRAHSEGAIHVDVELAIAERELERAALAWVAGLTDAEHEALRPTPFLGEVVEVRRTPRGKWTRGTVVGRLAGDVAVAGDLTWHALSDGRSPGWRRPGGGR